MTQDFHLNLRFPTPYPELNVVLEALVAGVQTALPANLVAIYLQGSFAIGDFDRESDVDFLVVTAQEVTEAEVTALQTFHAQLHAFPSDWAKHLDGSYISQEVLTHGETVGVQPLWYLDNGSNFLVRSVHDNTWVVRWMVREHGIPLLGPPPTTLIPLVPPTTLCAEVRQTMHDWGQELLTDPHRLNNQWAQPFAVLSYCRMLQTLETGKILSKLAAVKWAETHLDSRWATLAQRAWEARPNPAQKVHQAAHQTDLHLTREFIRYAIQQAMRGAIEG